jgi:hypothetical protein
VARWLFLLLALTLPAVSWAQAPNAPAILLTPQGGGSGGGSTAIQFTALANGTPGGSPIAGSGIYTSATLTSPTSASWQGGCSGATTITSFSASGGTWSADFSVPASACSGYIAVIWPNALAVNSPRVSIGTFFLLVNTGSKLLINTGDNFLVQ